MASTDGLPALRWASVLAACLFLSFPTMLDAQLVPGQGREGYWEAERARLRSERLQELTPVMEAWRDAFNDHAPERAAPLYARDAVLTIGGEIHRGADAIATALQRWMPALDRLELGLNDFMTGGQLVVVLESAVVGSGNAQRTATLMTTFIGTDDGWLIRAQTISDSVPPESPEQ